MFKLIWGVFCLVEQGQLKLGKGHYDEKMFKAYVSKFLKKHVKRQRCFQPLGLKLW